VFAGPVCKTRTAPEIHRCLAFFLNPSLAAAPTFAIMALTTGILGGGPGYMICPADHASLLDGMVPMYLVMSAFHSSTVFESISMRPSSRKRTRPSQ
jgi:hypothetical protein